MMRSLHSDDRSGQCTAGVAELSRRGEAGNSLAIVMARPVVTRYLPTLLVLEARLDQLEEEMIVRQTDKRLAELASDLMDGYITMASHRLNQTVKTLTIVTTVFVPLSFLAGLYGMNFENIPELHFRYGYFFVLGLMAATAAGTLLFMYRRGWLGERSAR